jgi:hypothetical protein
MQTLLVTIIGPQRTIDLEMPGEVPIGELLPIVMTLCGSPDFFPQQNALSSWGLGVIDAFVPLPLFSSLSAEKIVNGTILQLKERSAWASNRDGQKPKFVPEIIPPGPATGGIGIKWSKAGLLRVN